MIEKISNIISYIRFTPFDSNSELGREKERHRRIVLTVATGSVARVISMLVQFILVPLTLNYLGKERYGLWMTLSSMIAMLGFADLGLGNGIKNSIAHSSGKEDHQQIQQIVSSGIFVLSLIALFISVLFALIYKFVPWAALFNLNSSIARAESGAVIAALVLCFALMLPAGLVLQVQMGLQEGFQSNLWQIAVSFLSLVSVIIVIQMQAGLPWLVLAIAGAPVAVYIVNSISVGIQRPWMIPKWVCVNLETIKNISKVGSLFFVLQLGVVLNYQKDNLIIAHFLGAEHVAGYSIAMKLFLIPSMLLSLYLMPLWPAYAEANARGDKDWIKNSFQRSLKYSMLFTIPAVLFLVVTGRWIIKVWANSEVVPQLELLIGMGLWTISSVIGTVVAMLFNGLHIVKLQVLVVIPMTVINIVLSVFLVGKIGIVGVVWGTFIAHFFIAMIPFFIFLRRNKFI